MIPCTSFFPLCSFASFFLINTEPPDFFPASQGVIGPGYGICHPLYNSFLQVCHGIPDSRELEAGDIVNVDVTVFINGVHGDCSETFLVIRLFLYRELVFSHVLRFCCF